MLWVYSCKYRLVDAEKNSGMDGFEAARLSCGWCLPLWGLEWLANCLEPLASTVFTSSQLQCSSIQRDVGTSKRINFLRSLLRKFPKSLGFFYLPGTMMRLGVAFAMRLNGALQQIKGTPWILWLFTAGNSRGSQIPKHIIFQYYEQLVQYVDAQPHTKSLLLPPGRLPAFQRPRRVRWIGFWRRTGR